MFLSIKNTLQNLWNALKDRLIPEPIPEPVLVRNKKKKSLPFKR